MTSTPALLGARRVFRALSPGLISTLSRAATLITAPPLTTLVRAGEVSPAMWVLLAGKVARSPQTRPDDDEPPRVDLVPVDSMFGLGPVIEEPEAHGYATVSECRLIEFTHDALQRALAEEPALKRQLATRLSLRARADELAWAVQRAGPFASMTASQVRWLVESSTLTSMAEGERLCTEGETSDTFFFVARGEVAVERDTPSGRQVLATLPRGECFGEAAALSGRPRTANVSCVRAGELLVVGSAELTAMARESHELRRSLWSLSAERTGAGPAPAQARARVVAVVDHSGLPGTRAAELVAQAITTETGGEVITSAAPTTTFEPRRDADWVIYAVSAAAEAQAMALLAPHVDVAVIITATPSSATPSWAAALRTTHRLSWSGALSGPRIASAGGSVSVTLRGPAPTHARTLSELSTEGRRGLSALARGITRRRVGLALGGGAAWGYAHVALIRALIGAGVPIDAVCGVSFGSIAGAAFSSRGLDGLEALTAKHKELAAVALACTVSTVAAEGFMERLVPQRRIEDLPLPYCAVAVDIRLGAEHVFRDGSIAKAVRASCALPGVFAPTIIDGVRYVDACVKNNVPASHTEELADFVISSNVVPPPSAEVVGRERRRLRDAVASVSPLQRLRDGLRALYVVANDSGRRQSTHADAAFAPDLSAFLPTDFLSASDIITKADQQLEHWLPETLDQYRAFCRKRARA